MKFKRFMSAVLTAALALSPLGGVEIASADIAASPVISRNCPAYSQSSPSTAAAANDDYYYTSWSGTSPDYLAYDLSKVPESQRKRVIAVWYNNTGQYDYTVVNGNSSSMPTDYTIEVNKASGGKCPEDGWEVIEKVTGNTLHSRQHLVDMEGYNWIRMNVSASDGKSGGTAGINFDIHNVSDGAADSWIFFGDSITAGGMMNCYGTGFAEYINRIDSRYFPAQENGGIGGIFSTDGAKNIDRWLSTFPGSYVSIAYGTNDAWGNQTGADKYYENTEYMVKKVIAAGKTPVVPKIPYATEPGVNTYLDSYNAMIDKIYENYPEVVKGPDFDALFRENPELLSADGVHPSSEGYDKMRQVWAETMYKNVYTMASAEALKGDVNLDGKVDSKDVMTLKAHLTKETLLKSDEAYKCADLSGDGIVNVFDLILLKRELLGSDDQGELTDSQWEAVESNVKLVGRNVVKNGATWLLQSGSAAEFNVTGQSAELVIAGNWGVDADKDQRPRYAVYVDGELLTDKTLDSKEEKITLFDGTASSVKNVKVILLSEAGNGAVGVDSINVKSTSSKPVKPVAKKDLSIEFIGDSITCAYGVEGANAYENFKTTTENFTKSYAYLTAQKLDADYSAVCYSGHGIVSGYTSDGSKNSDSLIPDIYELDSKLSIYSGNWDFASHKNDVVVINLGTNDINYVAADTETRSAEFTEGYIDFLKKVRKNNSGAYIICTLGTMGGDEICPLIEDAVNQYKSETKDERVMWYKSATQDQADGIGSDWHPSAITQQKSAYVLADKICQALGMESDQVGLDVAADAVYDVEINKESGANAAHYVGYDKSFWINMVSGGSSPEDIVACLSGISLKKGGEYRFEFDYTTSVDMDFKVSVKGADTHFSDTVSSNSEKQHYSQTFKVTSDDSAARITYDIGGGSSYNVTLSGIKLTKIA